jgi:hypothetical protein
MLIWDKNTTDEILPIIYNIVVILRFDEEWKDVIDIEFNDPEEELIVIKSCCPPLAAGFQGRWTFDDSIMTAAWLQKNYKIMVTPEQVDQAVRVVGAMNCQCEASLSEKDLVII